MVVTERCIDVFRFSSVNFMTNTAFIDIRLRPGLTTPRGGLYFTTLSPRMAIPPTTVKGDVIHKPEVHNVAQRRQRRIEQQPQGICTRTFVKLGLAVPEICSRTHRQTDKLSVIFRSESDAA